MQSFFEEEMHGMPQRSYGAGRSFGSITSRERGQFYGRGPKGYARSDERIREDVCERLTDDSDIDAREITVTVQNGEVTLEGEVEDRRAERLAADIAREVNGVTDVHDRLHARKHDQLHVKKGMFSSTPPVLNVCARRPRFP